MENNRILIINDVTAYGRVSSVAMVELMTAYGLHPYVLPTAVVSNTMDYGSSVILDTTEFMRGCIDKWDEFGFKFPVICTGLINSAEQIEIISDLIDKQDKAFVLVDPIMADDGKIYPGMYEGAVGCYRRLASRSNLFIPNITEARLVAGYKCDDEYQTSDELENIIASIKELGAQNIVITGCKSENGETFNLVYDSAKGKSEKVYYDKVDINLVGTGDVFSALLISEITSGSSLYEAVDKSSQFIRKIAIANINNPDHFDINIESTIQEALHEIRQR